MKFQFSNFFSKVSGWAGKLLLVALIGYFIFLIFQAAKQNYQTSQKIKKLREEIASLERQKEVLQNLKIYYQTNTYKELEARRKLLLKKEGETVVPVEVKKEDLEGMEISETGLPTEAISSEPPPQVPKESMASLWWKYFFKEGSQ